MAPPLLSVFNHLVLPPQLPGAHNADSEEIGNALFGYLLDAFSHLRNLASQELAEAFDSTHRSLSASREINELGRLEKDRLLKAFCALGDDTFLLHHVVEQNAALLVRRRKT